MHRETAQKSRRSRSLVVLVLALAIVAVFGIAAQQALAVPDGSFNHGGATCANCHPPTPPTNNKCTACHTGGFAVPIANQTCWTCHTPGQNMAPVKTGAPASCVAVCHLANGTTSQHVAHTDGRSTDCTTCHKLTVSATNPNGSPHHTAKTLPATTVTLKVAPTSIMLKKTVTAAGVVTPVSLVGKPVALAAQMRSGTKWIKAKTVAVQVSAVGTTAAYSWTYKPLKKGTYRMQAAIKATTDYAASISKWVTFKVK